MKQTITRLKDEKFLITLVDENKEGFGFIFDTTDKKLCVKEFRKIKVSEEEIFKHDFSNTKKPKRISFFIRPWTKEVVLSRNIESVIFKNTEHIKITKVLGTDYKNEGDSAPLLLVVSIPGTSLYYNKIIQVRTGKRSKSKWIESGISVKLDKTINGGVEE